MTAVDKISENDKFRYNSAGGIIWERYVVGVFDSLFVLVVKVDILPIADSFVKEL
jgi:hypothetical protein